MNHRFAQIVLLLFPVAILAGCSSVAPSVPVPVQAPASPAKPSPTVVTIENALSMLTSPTIVQADIHDASPTTLIDRDGRLYTVDEHNPADRAKVQQAAFARHERDRTFTLFVE